MTEAVLDASVVLKWFGDRGEEREAEARMVRAAYEAGDMVVIAPRLLALEVMNVAGRRWRWDRDQLVELADNLEDLGFEWREASLDRVARWTADGLSAYDAAYVALAEEAGIGLVTDDDRIVALADSLDVPLKDWTYPRTPSPS